MKRTQVDTDKVPTVRDPHHGGIVTWCFIDGNYYQRHGIQKWWTRVKNIHLTPKRILALASITPESL